jgi:predicted HD phosphohydrolase
MRLDELFELLATGSTIYDEPEVDALSHALQCGAILRVEHPDDPELAIAGLLHDIADIADPSDHTDHDVRGGKLVGPLFGGRVSRLIAGHVIAKRYLIATDPAYRDQLSSRSMETLVVQGDALDTVDLAQMAVDPDLDAMVILRRADERAKDPNADVPDLESWRPLLQSRAKA